MINALLLLALTCQEADVTVQGRAHRQDGEYTLTLSGKGKGLRDQEIVSLRFRRLANRVNWADGAIATAPVEEESVRTATVEKQEFQHHERFTSPGEVEVQISLGRPEDGSPEEKRIRRVFRSASLAEEAHAIGSDARSFDAALRGLRSLMEDLDALKADPAPAMKKQGRLQKRIDWRKTAYRAQVEHSFLTASARALASWLDDVENASELERSGKEAGAMMSVLSGKPFSWAEARSQLAEIEALSLRERGLLVVRTLEALGREIAAAAHAGTTAHWGRVEKDFDRVLDALQENDQTFRGAPSGSQYAALADLEGVTQTELLQQARKYLEAAAGSVRCTPQEGCEVEELGRGLMDRAAAFEVRIRSAR